MSVWEYLGISVVCLALGFTAGLGLMMEVIRVLP
jgi:uncharacterized membrane protein YeiB